MQCASFQRRRGVGLASLSDTTNAGLRHWVEVGVDGFRMALELNFRALSTGERSCDSTKDGMPGPVQNMAEDAEAPVAHFAMIMAAVVRSAAKEVGRDVILVGSGDIDATCESRLESSFTSLWKSWLKSSQVFESNKGFT